MSSTLSMIVLSLLFILVGSDICAERLPLDQIYHSLGQLNLIQSSQIESYQLPIKDSPYSIPITFMIDKNLIGFHRPTLVLTGSLHGNEYLSIEHRLAHNLFTQKKIRKFINRGGAVIVLPMLNPEAYTKNKRSIQQDLNRTWQIKSTKHKTSPITEVVKSELDKLIDHYSLEIAVSIDYHCCRNALVIPWSKNKASLPAKDFYYYKAIAKKARKHLAIKNYGNTHQILGYQSQGTLKDYMYEKYQALSFTYEGNRTTEPYRLTAHIEWLIDSIEIGQKKLQKKKLSVMEKFIDQFIIFSSFRVATRFRH